MKGFGDQVKSKKKLNYYLTEKKYNQILNEAIKNHSSGNLTEASKYYQYLIEDGFKDERVFNNYGMILLNSGDLRQARIFISKVIELNPKDDVAYSNLGGILKELGELKEAELLIRKAIELNPKNSTTYLNLGGILQDLGKLEEAELSARKAIEIKSDYADAYLNLGVILKDLGKLQEAELSYLKAIEIKPNYAEAYFNLSLIELLQGNYQSGFENYEFRLIGDKPSINQGSLKIQRKDNKLFDKGEKLLIVSEQGLGDTLQYMRYIPYLRNKGLKISFCAHQKLHSLIKSSGIDQNPLTLKDAREVKEGKWIPLLSLPRYLEINSTKTIISEPYIFSTNQLKKKWEKILSKEKRPIIGINWQGNPKAEKKGLNGRSLPLETFAILTKNKNFKFLSLQKGFGSEQLNNCSFLNQFVECQLDINNTWDFLENAAIVENCDLIITSDTSIAHLAGGLGKATWLLLQHIPEWRWGLERENTLWYPSMRLFRQKDRNNWQEVMERVSIAITKEITK